MIELVFVGAMLPAVPVIDTIPNADIIMTQAYETVNPYVCISLTEQRIPTLEILKENIDKYLQAPSATTEELSDLLTQRQKTTKDLLANLITKHSCEVTANLLNKASETAKHIEDIITAEHLTNNQVFAFRYNQNRQTLLNSPQLTSDSKFRGLFQQVPRHANNKSDAPLFINSQILTRDILNHDYLKAIETYNLLISTSDEMSPLLHANILVNGAIITDLVKHPNDALQMLENAVLVLDTQHYMYSHALLANQVALVFATKKIYNKAIFYQEQFLNTIEKIPQDTNKYVRGLIDLAKMYRSIGQRDTAYLLLQKAHHILNINTFAQMELYYLDLGMEYYQTKSYQNAITTLSFAYQEAHKNLMYDLRFKSGSYLVLSLLQTNQLERAERIITELGELSKYVSVPNEAMEDFALLKAQLQAKKKKYKDAYETMLDLFKEHVKIKTYLENQYATQEQRRIILQNNINTKTDENANIMAMIRDTATLPSLLLTLLFLLMLLLSLYLHRKYESYRRRVEEFEENKRYSALFSLPNEQQLLSDLRDLGIEHRHDNTTMTNIVTNEKQLIHISLPDLSDMNITAGSTATMKFFKVFREQLKAVAEEDDNANIYELTKSRYIILHNKISEQRTIDLCNAYHEKLSHILTDLHISSRICLGIIDYPFLTHNPYSIDSHKILELSLMSIYGAMQLPGINTWVKLTAKNITKNLLTSGEIRLCVKEAIRHDAIKVQASHDKNMIKWD